MQYRVFSISLLFCLFNLTIFSQNRPHGPSRYGESKIQELNSIEEVYYFDIIEKQQNSPFVKKQVLNDVFSWGTLSQSNKRKPVLFRVRNTTKYPIFITDISNTSTDVFYTKTTDLIKVDTNEYMEIEVRFNPLKSGHFYCSMVVAYQSRYGLQEFLVRQYGFREEAVVENLNPIDSFYFQKTIRDIQNAPAQPRRFYISDANFDISSTELMVTLRTRDRVFYPKMGGYDGEVHFTFDYGRKFLDTVFIEVVNAKQIIAKMEIDNRRHSDNHIIVFAFPEKWEEPFYFGQSYPIAYTPLSSVFQLSYDYGEAKKAQMKDINAYLKKNGMNTQMDSRGFVFIPNMEEAIKLDKRLAALKYKIKLLPVFHYSTVDKSGWGGDCSWLTDIVDVRFYTSIPHARRMEILKEFDFVRTRKNYGSDDLIYTLRLKRMLDRKYIDDLNALYQVMEVKSITQQKNGITGLD